MSGGEINCGSFIGDDKSGSSFEAVINRIRNDVKIIAEDIDAQLKENEYVLVSPENAKILFPLLQKLEVDLISEIGSDNWHEEVQKDEDSGMNTVDAKWGKSKGWQLYCTTNLIKACQTSINENEQICLVFS